MKRIALLTVLGLLLSSTLATAQLRRVAPEPVELNVPEDCMNPEMAIAFRRTRLQVSNKNPAEGRVALAGAVSLDGIRFDEFAGQASVSFALVGTLEGGAPVFVFPAAVLIDQDRRGNFKFRTRGPAADQLALQTFVLRPGKDGDTARVQARFEIELTDGTTLDSFQEGTMEFFLGIELLDGTNACGDHDVEGFTSTVLN